LTARGRENDCSDFLRELYVKGNFIPITAIASGMRDEWKKDGEIDRRSDTRKKK